MITLFLYMYQKPDKATWKQWLSWEGTGIGGGVLKVSYLQFECIRNASIFQNYLYN